MQTVQPLNRLPAFSPPRAAPAGPERGPRRPSSLGAVPLGNHENICKTLCFATCAGGLMSAPTHGAEPTRDPAEVLGNMKKPKMQGLLTVSFDTPHMLSP